MDTNWQIYVRQVHDPLYLRYSFPICVSGTDTAADLLSVLIRNYVTNEVV
jgi:hypothetical protein